MTTEVVTWQSERIEHLKYVHKIRSERVAVLKHKLEMETTAIEEVERALAVLGEKPTSK